MKPTRLCGRWSVRPAVAAVGSRSARPGRHRHTADRARPHRHEVGGSVQSRSRDAPSGGTGPTNTPTSATTFEPAVGVMRSAGAPNVHRPVRAKEPYDLIRAEPRLWSKPDLPRDPIVQPAVHVATSGAHPGDKLRITMWTAGTRRTRATTAAQVTALSRTTWTFGNRLLSGRPQVRVLPGHPKVLVRCHPSPLCRSRLNGTLRELDGS
jgi:hypothetical protein